MTRVVSIINRLISAVSIAAVLVVSAWVPPSASALSASDFNPGRIIDDFVFYNKNAMTAAQIQTFLSAKVPNCDTNGTQNYSYYYNSSTGEINNSNSGSWVTTSRATYGQRLAAWAGSDWRGSQAPYVCIKDKKLNTSNIAADGLCNGYSGANNESVATVLYKIAQSCGINPQVMLVTLQKEQALVTDTWPFGIQYEKAMGLGCPDHPPAEWAPKNCDPAYLGFEKQMYYGARRFKQYQANPNNYNYVAGRNNQILWHPNAGCGTSTVYIQNQATAALYIYTPYRPNQAALNNMYGTGDGCSSYGIRNFWRIFHDWFGSTYGFAAIPEVSARYQALGGVNGLGSAVDGGWCENNRTTCWQQFENGFILYRAGIGAWESKGPIRARWAALGYQNGSLGFPVGPVYEGGGGMQWQQYQNGYIVGSPSSGFWESKGAIRAYWGSIGYQNGKLGLPAGPEYGDGSQWWQQYQNGYIVGSGATGYWESMGAIRQRWGQMGYQNGSLGFPVEPEFTNADGSGWQRYQRGYIVKAAGAANAWESKGAIRAYWGSIGYQNGKAGWPTGPEVYNASTNTWSQTYQKGTIYYSDATGGRFVAN